MTTTYGTLYGVGVGPGAPDLLTVRALETCRKVPVLVLPRGNDFGQSMAWKILKPALGDVPGQERLFLTFPMSKDPVLLRPAFDRAFEQIGARLEKGLSVAFATEGDPSLFSTFIYLKREAAQRWPGLQVEVVPGVSSVTAVSAVAGLSLADGLERIAILPATYGVDDLEEVLSKFDTTLLMKIGGEMPKIVDALERQGIVDKAVFVSKATMAEQRIIRDVREVREEHCDCFAMVVVAKKHRSGLLAGALLDKAIATGAAAARELSA